MTLAQLCCTSWALAACAELGVQGPESVLADQLNFPAVSCIVMFPASRKRCEKVESFGAQNPIYPEMSSCLTASFILRKGILLLLPICFGSVIPLFEIWIYLVLSENYLFLLWYYSSEYSRSRSCDESELLLESFMDSDFSSAKIVQHESLQRYNRS
jgi:hypothetical protein